jgi:hypothetical protein
MPPHLHSFHFQYPGGLQRHFGNSKSLTDSNVSRIHLILILPQNLYSWVAIWSCRHVPISPCGYALTCSCAQWLTCTMPQWASGGRQTAFVIQAIGYPPVWVWRGFMDEYGHLVFGMLLRTRSAAFSCFPVVLSSVGRPSTEIPCGNVTMPRTPHLTRR